MVSDVSLVHNFYTALFHWRIEHETEDRYGIRTDSGLKIGAIQVAERDVKGSKEFWAVYFAVSDLHETLHTIKKAGGRTGGIYHHEYGIQGLAYDDQGAAFFMIQGAETVTPVSSISDADVSGKLKWRSLTGLIAIYMIILFEQTWAWGIFFLFWVIPDLKSGTTYFIEPLSRRSNPFIYWAVVFTWIGLSAYLLLDIL